MSTVRVGATNAFYHALVITRPLNCLIAAASVGAGAFLAGRTVSTRAGLVAGMTFLVCAGGYVLNDYFDVVADRLTKPHRPLVTGVLKPAFAARYAASLWVAAGLLAVLAGRSAIAFWGAWVFLLWLYSARLKDLGLYGHLVVSLVASSGFVAGALIEGRTMAGVLPAAIATAFHLARETVKSVADAAGDKAGGVRTLAVRIGNRSVLTVTLWLIIGCAVMSVVPFLLRVYGLPYFVVVLVVVYPLLAICLRRIVGAGRGGEVEAAASSVAFTLKLAMVAGLAAFFLAGV